VPTIKQHRFGETLKREAVERYCLTNHQGIEASIMTYGATLVSLRAPDRNGVFADVVLGFEQFSSYLDDHPYFGCVIGRYANRIAGARFSIGGSSYRLEANDGRNHLHGGAVGFDKTVWAAEAQVAPDGPQLALTYLSRAGEEGYPGNLRVKLIYTLTGENELRLDYSASTDQDTVINLTNHSYFNLAGAGTIEDHLLQVAAEHYLPVDDELIPRGEYCPVRSTAFDFTRPREIGSGINADDPQIKLAGGYDHCWVLTDESRLCSRAAELHEPASGRLLTVFTTQPGIQVYSGNLLNGSLRGKGGQAYMKHSGLCLETQHFPNSPNEASFPSTLLRPGELYQQTTVYRFGVRE
jgi:aldose 1-epimerase